jgi:choline dehydrogenase-like flavoprotein
LWLLCTTLANRSRNPSEIPEISTPARAFELRGSEYDWGYKTTLIDRPEYTRVEKPNTRGKVLGGSSAVNYYTWVRGSAATYNDWAEYGGSDWNWENTKDYFNKCATYHDDENLYPSELARIGKDGPLDVSHSELVHELKPFRDALQKAWTSKGQELSTDVYNGTQKGLFKCINSIYKGVRSTSASFLEGKRNITLMSFTLSKNIIIEGGKAVGVTVIGPDDKDYTFRAKNEIVISQGVFESPKLLLLSGIGPKAELQEKGVKPLLESKHVGKNLLDHPILPHVFRLKDGYGLDGHLLREGEKKKKATSSYNKDHGGPYSSGLLELVAFPRIDEHLKKNKQYNELVKKNGGKDPFGPGGQPHFEVDFVVSIRTIPERWQDTDFMVAHVR